MHRGNTKANILTREWEFPADFRWLLYAALPSVISLFMLAKVENKHKFHFAACRVAPCPSLYFLL